MSVSDVFLDAAFKYISRISVTHTFRSRLKGWNLRYDTKMYFYRGCHEDLKDFLSQKNGVMFFPLWKCLAMNIAQISGACSLIRQK